MRALTLLLAALLVAQHFTSLTGDLFDDADSDGNEVLDYDEFKAVLPSVPYEAFRTTDTNGDGVVDDDEFENGVDEGYFRER